MTLIGLCLCVYLCVCVCVCVCVCIFVYSCVHVCYVWVGGSEVLQTWRLQQDSPISTVLLFPLQIRSEPGPNPGTDRNRSESVPIPPYNCVLSPFSPAPLTPISHCHPVWPIPQYPCSSAPLYPCTHIHVFVFSTSRMSLQHFSPLE